MTKIPSAIQHGFSRLVAGGLVLVLAGGCAQTGDFGRVSSDPTLAANVSALFGAQSFNLTDQEREMQRRIHRFRTRNLGFLRLQTQINTSDPTAYYAGLQRLNFSSSHGRYNKLSDDVQADVLAAPGVFQSICAVQETDRQRLIAADGLLATSAITRQEVTMRQIENEASHQSFSETLTFRYDSYVVALEQLLIETPHEEAVQVDSLLSNLAAVSQRARDDRYCTVGNAAPGASEAMILADNLW